MARLHHCIGTGTGVCLLSDIDGFPGEQADGRLLEEHTVL